jgi:hypothetical protein
MNLFFLIFEFLLSIILINIINIPFVIIIVQHHQSVLKFKAEQADSREKIKFLVKKGAKIDESYPGEEGVGVSALWDKSRFDRLDDLFYDFRKGKLDSFEEFTNNCVDKALGIVPKNDSYAPKLAHCGHNVITHPGIALTNKNITGQDMTRFLYIFSGTDNSQTPTIYSDHIEEENARMSILDTGFFFASGTALFQGCVFPTTIPNAQVKAFGSATTADPDDPNHLVFWVMRILDPLKYINHEQNKTVYTHMHVIDRRSRLSE